MHDSVNHEEESEKIVKRKFSFLKRVYWDRIGIYSIASFVSIAGINEETIQRCTKLHKETVQLKFIFKCTTTV